MNLPGPTPRRLLALTTAIPCLLLPAAHAAEAPVSSFRMAAVQLVLAGPEGSTLEIELRVHDREGGDLVTVGRSVCDDTGCSPADHFAGVVHAGAVTVDEQEAAGAARLVLGGRELVVTWAPDAQPGHVIGGVQGSANDGGEAVGTYVADPATADVALDGAGCLVESAAVGNSVRVTVPEGSNGGALPLSALRLPSGGLVCAPAAT